MGAVADAGGEFTVKLDKKEVVAAALSMQEHWLPLSNLDLLLPPVDVGVFFCYTNPTTTASQKLEYGSMVGILKAALGKALVSYYALAGEVIQNSVGEPELLCNNRGVDFTEAFAEVELRHLNLYNPDETIEGKLVPTKKRGVLAVQATELKCGGIVVACTFDHRIADAYSANMFLVFWADKARSAAPISLPPSFNRSLLNPRRPLCVNASLDSMYLPVSALPPPPKQKQKADEACETTTSRDDDCVVSRMYYVTAAELSKLQQRAYSNGSKRSKLESFSAFLWKMVAESSSGASNDDDKRMSRMGIVVDGRCRLESAHGRRATPMASYFGNVLSKPFGEKRTTEVMEKPLSWVAEAVHEFVQRAATREHFLDLIDWVEEHRSVPAVARIYCKSGSAEEEEEGSTAFVVSSGQRFPVTEMDFGWGKPALGSYHFPWGGEAGYVMPMPSPLSNGDWVVYLHLARSQVAFIESHAPTVFRPLTPRYLNLL
ncbi:LOW QUALITY PROTEIN: coniferyl alcohol acyltransferase [Eucalyptus grandis]|uniref:LOW QUALITY PROTEIN: coniferyl alcohol acyltransferase n=1 Tax=Eucalyptus grandis TaxID=71139 RepID=UPI00192F058C|nr:LOW QUALITY PROTEIN: coniferyl alcohol acyltransferase [Eucalyptus grandis]